MNKPPVIDHHPDERPRKQFGDGWLWWACWIGIGLLWLWFFIFEAPNWVSIGMGFVTGGMLASWATDITGNRIPGSSSKK